MVQATSNVIRAIAAREAGNVRRCHTVPHIGEYTVGKHSFDAVSLLLIIHPSPEPELVKAVLWHDAGERWVGDAPAPARWASGSLDQEYEELEQQARENAGIDYGQLSPEQRRWLNAVDKLELLMFCNDQLAMGNRHVERMRQNVVAWFDKTWASQPAEVQAFFKELRWERLGELGQLISENI